MERKLEDQAKRQEEIASMVQRLDLAVAQRVEVINVNDIGSTAVKIGELVVQQPEKREQFESPAS